MATRHSKTDAPPGGQTAVGRYRLGHKGRTCRLVIGSRRETEIAAWREFAVAHTLAVKVVPSARRALNSLFDTDEHVDLAILDGTKAELPPQAFCDACRAGPARTPAIFYVAESYSARTHAAVMQAGATQFAARPIDIEVMLAIAEAELRRSGHFVPAVALEEPFRKLEVNRKLGTIRIENTLVRLSPSLLEILHLLASQNGAFVSLTGIAKEALGLRNATEYDVRDRVYQQIRRLRRALPPRLQIEELRREGYRLVRG